MRFSLIIVAFVFACTEVMGACFNGIFVPITVKVAKTDSAEPSTQALRLPLYGTRECYYLTRPSVTMPGKHWNLDFPAEILGASLNTTAFLDSNGKGAKSDVVQTFANTLASISERELDEKSSWDLITCAVFGADGFPYAFGRRFEMEVLGGNPLLVASYQCFVGPP